MVDVKLLEKRVGYLMDAVGSMRAQVDQLRKLFLVLWMVAGAGLGVLVVWLAAGR